MKKILVVDDDSGVLSMLKLMLEDAGYEIILASNGGEGILKAKAELPDLIISDILMPIMDGFIFYKALRKDKRTANIPILILTARGQMEDSFRAIGADDFIEKPSERKELLSKVEKLLNRPRTTKKRKSGKKVLVAGTYKNIVENMIVQLQKQGCETEFVFTGAEIISESVVFEPNLIIMEIQMDGARAAAEYIKAVRLMPKFKKTPILLYSYFRVHELGVYEYHQKADTITACTKKCINAGATDYIGKFNEKKFLTMISQYL